VEDNVAESRIVDPVLRDDCTCLQAGASNLDNGSARGSGVGTRCVEQSFRKPWYRGFGVDASVVGFKDGESEKVKE
jgi:hypothetical protein